MSWKPGEHHILKKNQWREFHPILVTVVYGFIDLMISFWDQKVKSQSHIWQWSEKPCEYNIFVTIGGNFTAAESDTY